MNENIVPPGIIRMRCHTGHSVVPPMGGYNEWYLKYKDEYFPVEIEINGGQRFSVGDEVICINEIAVINGFKWVDSHNRWEALFAGGQAQFSFNVIDKLPTPPSRPENEEKKVKISSSERLPSECGEYYPEQPSRPEPLTKEEKDYLQDLADLHNSKPTKYAGEKEDGNPFDVLSPAHEYWRRGFEHCLNAAKTWQQSQPPSQPKEGELTRPINVYLKEIGELKEDYNIQNYKYAEAIAEITSLKSQLSGYGSVVEALQEFCMTMTEYLEPGCFADNHSYLKWVERAEKALKNGQRSISELAKAKAALTSVTEKNK